MPVSSRDYRWRALAFPPRGCIAANFGEQGVICVLRVPRDLAITPIGWQGLALESEYVILNSVPPGSVLRKIPALEVSPLTVNGEGLLVPGTRVP